ncbi:hypothetical protein JD844_000918 [Phrynosoma platyrhinos]|uniref:Uncharacterized protein n=1 Tax=Phrynosoma platyrhinos TaxID=52577 RepID=A0ABQ7T9D0_PHRPL|nr:hypothetical protein JD844_000918 [Phrynosoma platyrhinos]
MATQPVEDVRGGAANEGAVSGRGEATIGGEAEGAGGVASQRPAHAEGCMGLKRGWQAGSGGASEKSEGAALEVMGISRNDPDRGAWLSFCPGKEIENLGSGINEIPIWDKTGRQAEIQEGS